LEGGFGRTERERIGLKWEQGVDWLWGGGSHFGYRLILMNWQKEDERGEGISETTEDVEGSW